MSGNLSMVACNVLGHCFDSLDIEVDHSELWHATAVQYFRNPQIPTGPALAYLECFVDGEKVGTYAHSLDIVADGVMAAAAYVGNAYTEAGNLLTCLANFPSDDWSDYGKEQVINDLALAILTAHKASYECISALVAKEMEGDEGTDE